jgi:hypothetical protein
VENSTKPPVIQRISNGLFQYGNFHKGSRFAANWVAIAPWRPKKSDACLRFPLPTSRMSGRFPKKLSQEERNLIARGQGHDLELMA